MANYIFANKKEILRIKSSWLEILQEKLTIICEQNRIVDSHILKFLDKINPVIYGGGSIFIDINDFFKNNPESLNLFIQIFSQALKELIQEYNYNQNIIDLYENFKQELIIYLNLINIKT